MNSPPPRRWRNRALPAPPGSGSVLLSPDARRMLRAIDGLPEDEREVFDLVRIQGLTQAEAAGVVGVSVKTVQRRLNRARRPAGGASWTDLRPDVQTGPGSPGRTLDRGDPPMAGNSDVCATARGDARLGRSPGGGLPRLPRAAAARSGGGGSELRLVGAGARRAVSRSGTPRRRRPAVAVPTAELPRIPGYEVEAVLGRGGMGVVYRARHLRLNRPVALKMLLAGAFARPEELERFLREAQAVAGLRHPNIVQVYDVGDLDGLPYFTMEFVEGGSLAQKSGRHPATGPRRPPHWSATLAEAVQAAHQSGIVHRDLKPANILLTADGTPKVTDFGLARRLDGGAGADAERHPVGTPSYMAPEQARGRSAGDRAGHGRVRPGGDPLRAAHGPAAVPGGDAGGDGAAGDRPGAGARRRG